MNLQQNACRSCGFTSDASEVSEAFSMFVLTSEFNNTLIDIFNSLSAESLNSLTDEAKMKLRKILPMSNRWDAAKVAAIGGKL